MTEDPTPARRRHPMARARPSAILLGCLVAACSGDAPLEPSEPVPPLGPTIFIDPDIIRPDDPTTLVSVDSAGTGEREMFDRREEAFVTYEAHLFDAEFDDDLSAEIQVNPEFDAVDALAAAEKYAEVIGRLPTALRADVATVWIHRGTELFGGGDGNILIHTGQADLYEADEILEEALIHEAAHTSMDADHAASAGWIGAQEADGNFISAHAAENPTTEDVAESFVPYIAVRFQSDRITNFLANVITNAMAARIAYLDAQGFDMHPLD